MDGTQWAALAHDYPRVQVPPELRRHYQIAPDLLRARHPFPYIRRSQRGRLWLPSGLRDERGFLYVPANDFQWRRSSEAGIRPAAAWGTAVTPGNNTKGTAVEIMSDLEFDAWGVAIFLNSNVVNTAIRDALVDILIDPAGGTSYTVTVIPNLLIAGVNALGTSGPMTFYFPLFIPAGAAVAAAASVNNSTVGTLRVSAYVFGKPRRPELCKVGQYVTAVGVDTANSRGTLITPGTTSEGAWTSLGTPTRSHFWWQVGMGIADSVLGADIWALDLGVGESGSQRVILEDVMFGTSGGEAVFPFNNVPPAMCVAEVPANVEVWGRMQLSAAAQNNHSMAAYGCGG